MTFDFLGLRKSVESLAGNLRNVRGKIEALKREREELLSAPHSKDDVTRLLTDRIDIEGQKYAKQLRVSLQPAIRRGTDMADSIHVPLLTACPPNVTANERTIEAAFCLLFNEQMKSAVAAAVHSMDWPDGAVLHSDRVKKLGALDGEIGRLEAEELELANHARAAGVILS